LKSTFYIAFFLSHASPHISTSTLSLHDALPIYNTVFALKTTDIRAYPENYGDLSMNAALRAERIACQMRNLVCLAAPEKRGGYLDRKSTRLNSSHVSISYAVFCLKQKINHTLGP